MPQPLIQGEVEEYVEWFEKAAKTAIEAGFGGVEIHGTIGCFVDQFTQENSNKRTDEYGSSVEK